LYVLEYWRLLCDAGAAGVLGAANAGVAGAAGALGAASAGDPGDIVASTMDFLRGSKKLSRIMLFLF
jgi:hypothetical protein